MRCVISSAFTKSTNGSALINHAAMTTTLAISQAGIFWRNGEKMIAMLKSISAGPKQAYSYAASQAW